MYDSAFQFYLAAPPLKTVEEIAEASGGLHLRLRLDNAIHEQIDWPSLTASLEAPGRRNATAGASLSPGGSVDAAHDTEHLASTA